MLKKLLSDTIKYGVGKVILKFFSVLIVPAIIAKIFQPDILGELNIVITFVGLFTGIATLGLDAAIEYFYFHGDDKLKGDYLGTSFIIRILFSLLLFIGIIFLSKILSGADFILKDSEKYLLIILGAAVIPFDNCMIFFVDLTRLLMKPIIYNIANIFKVIFYFIFILIFLKKGLTVENIFIAILISSAIPALILFFIYKKLFNFKINIYCLKRLLIYGLPLVPVSITGFFIISANRFVLNAYTSLEEIGIFTMMITVASIFNLITSSINMAWPPYAMIIAKREDAQVVFARIITLLYVFLIPFAFILWSVADIFILLFSRPIYIQGENIIILLSMQHILTLLYYCFSIGLKLKEKTIYITIGYTIAAIVTILISFPLCKYFGIFGAALSSCIGYLISTLYIAFKSHKLYPIPYNFKYLIIYSFVLFIVISFSLLLPNSNILINFIFRFIIGFIYLLIPFFTKLISFNELKPLLIRKTI